MSDEEMDHPDYRIPHYDADLSLNGPTPVLYYDPDDEALDGNGFNVLLANGLIVDRFATVEQAFEAYRALLDDSPAYDEPETDPDRDEDTFDSSQLGEEDA